jgi:hypothetical protein
MSIITVRKINNHTVDRIPNLTKRVIDDRPPLGQDILSEIYAIVAMVGKKKSRKTSTEFKLITECIDSDTKVYIFAHTLNAEESGWLDICEWLKQKNISFEGFEKIDGNIQPIMKELKEKYEERKLEREKAKQKHEPKPKYLFDEPVEKKKKKKKYKVPEVLFVFDDINQELRKPFMVDIISENRHWLSKVLFSTHEIMKLDPMARKMVDVWMIYRGQDDKLEEIYNCSNLQIPYDLFVKLYKESTEHVLGTYIKNGLEKKIYDFFYVDSENDDLRRGLNYRYDISKLVA